jgi:anion-transporting  ArsA/GET3 family ATPase
VKQPITIVCAGGGGVGKTTTAAAIAVALARTGATTLVVTVDPARRLAHAMGVEIDERVQPAHVEPGVEGKLFALMPEPRRSTPTFAQILYEGRPDDLARVMKNPVYRTMADAAAGMHEIVSLILVAKAVEERDYDYLVIDTAPSRNALDFVSYPGRLAVLFEGRAVAWLGRLATRVNAPEGSEEKRGGGLFAGAQERIENMFSRILNARFLKDLAQLFSDLALVKERFARFARIAEGLLLGSKTSYVLVAAPTGSAQADAVFLSKKLGRLEQTARLALLNRADETAPPWLEVLRKASGGWPALGSAIQQMDVELANRKRAGDRLEAVLTKDLAGVARLRLPTIEAADPAVVVRMLATQLGPHLAKIAPR